MYRTTKEISLVNKNLSIYCKDIELDLSNPIIMGVLNLTPDSFFKDSRVTADEALNRAQAMINSGAHILDLGGESSRPGATPVSLEEELDRVIPVVELIHKEFDTVISVDTVKPEVMEAALKAGASMINDINALQNPGAIEVAAKYNAGVCLMHKQGSPKTMQENPTYESTELEVEEFLKKRIEACIKAGIDKKRICIDPGYGFGKTLEHNLELMRTTQNLRKLGCPLLVGISRKSMLGKILDKDEDNRLYGSLVAHLLLLLDGASIVRTHDVEPTKDTIEVLKAYLG